MTQRSIGESTPKLNPPIYLSGPMTGLPGYNYALFNEVAGLLRLKGFNVINPAENFGGQIGFVKEKYMRKDIEDMLKCSEVFFLPGWDSCDGEDLKGSKVEYIIGRTLKLPLYEIDVEALRFSASNDICDGGSSYLSLIPSPHFELRPWSTETPEPQNARGHLERAESVLDEASSLVDGERQGDYGHPLDDFTKTAKMISGLLKDKLTEDITPEEFSRIMVIVKLSREQNKHKRDNIVDAIGYLLTHQMVLTEREKRCNQNTQ